MKGRLKMKGLKKLMLLSLVASLSLPYAQIPVKADIVSRGVVADNETLVDGDVVDCTFEGLYELYTENGTTDKRWIGKELFQDSNSEGNIVVFHAPKDTDLTKLILNFDLDNEAELYLKDSKTPIEDYETVVDFSKGAL